MINKLNKPNNRYFIHSKFFYVLFSISFISHLLSRSYPYGSVLQTVVDISFIVAVAAIILTKKIEAT